MLEIMDKRLGMTTVSMPAASSAAW